MTHLFFIMSVKILNQEYIFGKMYVKKCQIIMKIERYVQIAQRTYGHLAGLHNVC